MKEKRRKAVSNKGFSLVEVLLAVVVLALVIIPIMQLFVTSMNISNRSRHLLGATEVGQMTLEVLNSKCMDGDAGIETFFSSVTPTTKLPAASYNVVATVGISSTNLSDEDFVTMTKSSRGGSDTKMLIYAMGDTKKHVSLHNVTHNGYVYDVVVHMTRNGSGTDEYYTYSVYLEVFGAEAGNHYKERLVTMDSAVVNKY